MSLELNDFLELNRRSRRHFLKHLDGLTEEQWCWKPYPESKSIRETIVHLIWVDRGVLISLETAGSPDWMAFYAVVNAETANDAIPTLLQKLDESHKAVLNFFTTKHTETSLGDEVSMWGHSGKLGVQLAYLTSEDHYHAGQVAFIRMATDPKWDYYRALYT